MIHLRAQSSTEIQMPTEAKARVAATICAVSGVTRFASKRRSGSMDTVSTLHGRSTGRPTGIRKMSHAAGMKSSV